MPMKQIAYTPSRVEDRTKEVKEEDDEDLPRTFVLNVDEEAYGPLMGGHPEDVSMTHDQFKILKFQSDGTLAPATRKELWKAFDHRDEYHVAYIIAHKGHLEGTFPKPNELHNEIFA